MKPFPPAPPSSTASNSTNPFPNLTVPFVQDGGLISPLWARLLGLIWIKAGGTGAAPLETITVGASPFSYTAPQAGTVVVAGGTVSALTITRGTAVSLGVVSGAVPVRQGDIVTVTYTGAPTMTFFPL